MSKNLASCALLLAPLLATAGSTGAAAVTTFTDRASWRTAAGGGTGDVFEDFNGISSDTSFNTSSLVVGSITLSATGSDTSNARQKVDAPPTDFGGDVDGTTVLRLRSLDNQYVTRITFSGSVQAFGFDLDNPFDSNRTQSVRLSDGTELSPYNATTTSFYGVVLDGSDTTDWIEIFDLSENTDNVADNLEAFSAVPEPGTLLLCGLGLVGIGLFGRRR